jgi:glycosyltransferase involved in cell wall biosynthesis
MTHQASRFMRLVGHENVLSAALVYDFIPYDLPHYLDRPGTALEYASCVQWLKVYDVFFPISHFSARRLWHYTLAAEDRTFVTGCALRASLLDALRIEGPPPGRPNASRQRYFVLATGDDIRKNSEVAVEALRALHCRGRSDVCMKVLGVHSSAMVRWLSAVPPVLRELVEIIHEVPDTQLRGLYAGAVATIVPSRMEGFSLPIVESVACGTPVIASAVEAHRELIHDEAALFEPADPAALAARMEAALDEPEWRGRVLDSQRIAATNAAPERVWERFWSPLLETFVRRGLGRRGRGATTRRSRVALVTPFPPDESGVARYSEATVAALAELCDVSVFTDAARSAPHRPPHPTIAGCIDVGPLLHESFDAVILVTGNSPFHDRILDLCERYGGPAILHDSRLTQIYAKRWGRREFHRRGEIIAGRRVTDEEIDQWLRDENSPSLFLEPIIGAADPLIVHTEPCRALVKRLYGVEAALVPFATASRFTAADLRPEGREEARARLGVAAGTLLISTFGYAMRSKGTAECVMAVRQLRDWNIEAELHVVGSNEHLEKELVDVVRELHLSDAVRTYPNFVSDDLYADYMQASDIAIQLRTYGFGQFSAALAECIATGMASVATADLADACEAPDFVRRIPMGATALQIAEAVRDLYDSGTARTRLHAERDHYLQRHSFGAYAKRLLAVLDL